MSTGRTAPLHDLDSARNGASPAAPALGVDPLVADLLVTVDQDPWGSTSPSVYETARAQTWAPWLPGGKERTAWLLDRQRPDGEWGDGPSAYRLLPTLAAVAELLRGLAAGPHDRVPHPTVDDRVSQAVASAVHALTTSPHRGELPDTAAVELLAPALIAEVNDRLDALAPEDHPTLSATLRGQRLPGPRGERASTTAEIARRLAARPGLPAKLHHCFEPRPPCRRESRAAGARRERGPGGVRSRGPCRFPDRCG